MQFCALTARVTKVTYSSFKCYA